MNKYLIGFSVIILIFVAIAGFAYFTTDKNYVSMTGDISHAKTSIVPQDIAPSTISEIEGNDFAIECDKTIYKRLSELEVICKITNINNSFNLKSYMLQ